MGGNLLIHLGGFATLSLSGGYGAFGVTMALDGTVLTDAPGLYVDRTIVEDVRIVYGERRHFYFDCLQQSRHFIDVAGKVFVVTLIKIDTPKIDGVAAPFAYTFKIGEN